MGPWVGRESPGLHPSARACRDYSHLMPPGLLDLDPTAIEGLFLSCFIDCLQKASECKGSQHKSVEMLWTGLGACGNPKDEELQLLIWGCEAC